MPGSPDAGGPCKCCCGCIFSLGLTALFLWLSLRPSKPKCSLQQIYFPSLNRTLNSTNNNTVIFEFQLENTNKDKGVYYDPVNVTFFDSPNRTHLIANFSIPAFYQGHKKKAKKGGNTSIIDRQAVLRAVADNGSAVFWVDLATAVRYKIMGQRTKRHRIAVGADVHITEQGTKPGKPKKGISLKSNAAKIGGYFGQKMGFIIVFLVIGLLDFWWTWLCV